MRIPHKLAFLPRAADDPAKEPIVAWADSPGLALRRAAAAAIGVPCVLLGDGLLRAAPRAGATPPRLSGVAIAACRPADTDDWPLPAEILAARGWETPALIGRAAAARRALVTARVGGAWWQHGGENELPKQDGYALVALAEPAVGGGKPIASDAVLAATLEAALAENPPTQVVVLAAGVGWAVRRRLAAVAARGATVIRQALDPWIAIERAARVYSVGGEIGLLALLAGRPVAAFGAAFHTGWGVTRDARAVPPQAFTRSIDEILAAYCLVATCYRDPFRDTSASFEETLELLAEWRRIELANRRIAVCLGMAWWKRRRIAAFLRSAGAAPVFRRTAQAAIAAALDRSPRPGEPGGIAVWASRLPPGLAEAARRRGIPLIRVEDGFVRSVGLGADLMPAASLVFDARGIYFDPCTESGLERLLCGVEFTPELIERARRLIALLVARGITKYNLAGRAPLPPMPRATRHILVPGQVEDDQSLLLGGAAVRRNLDLLAQVRAANRDAFILYKPHPDVAAGHRRGAVPETQARRFADAVLHKVSTAALLAAVDEVHTMTSLAGFEALLRRRQVVVYGRPFYAGWGLTTDLAAIARGRRLALEELVAGALILYPRYLDPLTRLPCGPELLIERLSRPELWRPGMPVLARRLQGALLRHFSDIRVAP
jgi:capsular polysaccharide export protein